MTVINAMVFGPEEGGMVADSQSSYSVRKYDFADKIVPIRSTDGNTVLMVGGCGMADILNETTGHLQRTLAKNEPYGLRHAADSLADIACRQKRGLIEQQVFSTFGLDALEVSAGVKRTKDEKTVPLDGQLKKAVMDEYTGQSQQAQHFFNGGFLLIGMDKERSGLYTMGFGNFATEVSRLYGSIGSGGDEADRVLYQFVKSLKRESRREIDFLEGMSALIRATTAASEINQGVGGVPAIAYFSHGEYTILNEDESRLAAEVVRVADAGLLSRDKQNESLHALLREKKPFADVEKVFEADHQKIMRFLRGYKE